MSKNGEPSWFYRRSMAFGIVAFCGGVIAFSGWLPIASDTTIAREMVNSAFWLLFAVYLLYGGFATVQDLLAIYTTRSAKPYAERVESTEPPPAAGPVTVTNVVNAPGPGDGSET